MIKTISDRCNSENKNAVLFIPYSPGIEFLFTVYEPHVVWLIHTASVENQITRKN